MSEVRHIIVDRYPLGGEQLSPDGPIAFVYSNAPTIELIEEAKGRRNKVQPLVADLAAVLKLPLFGPALNWAHRCYRVHRLSTAADLLPSGKSYAGSAAAVLDDEPTQPSAPAAREEQIASANAAKHARADSPLHLFNVLVALEWEPNADDLRQLMWTFRRASDFLYDVTDGYMAFGQVIFGDQSMMASADIQILASNRLLPRSWVGGMHDREKFMPIRLGRGLWHDRNHTTIPWDEPEAYRTLIHEWGHYALHLRDGYLTLRDLVPARGTQLPTVRAQLLHRAPDGQTGDYAVAMPTIGLISQSIMANLEGTSELTHHASDDHGSHVADEWKTIRETGYYPDLPDRSLPLDGPGRLPLPLPLFGRQSTKLAAQQRISFPTKPKHQQEHTPDVFQQLPPQLEHCWLYVLSGLTPTTHDPARLIAQGTLDARSDYTPFQLLGAQPGDTVLLIAETRSNTSDETSDDTPTVLRSTISAEGAFTTWQPSTPPSWPTVDVIPQAAQMGNTHTQIRVRVTSAGQRPDQIMIFPLGHEHPEDVLVLGAPDRAKWISAPQAIKTLDGYVFMRWGEQMMVVPFSQGGGPSFHSPEPANPITAGSSDGAAALFFYDRKRAGQQTFDAATMPDYSGVKVITTLAHGITGSMPQGARARSHTYSMAGNARLPLNLAPTLVMYYDPLSDDEALGGDLLICRLQGQEWVPLPSYLPPGYPFVATPLRAPDTGGTLVAPKAAKRVEYYKVCWLPRAT